MELPKSRENASAGTHKRKEAAEGRKLTFALRVVGVPDLWDFVGDRERKTDAPEPVHHIVADKITLDTEYKAGANKNETIPRKHVVLRRKMGNEKGNEDVLD